MSSRSDLYIRNVSLNRESEGRLLITQSWDTIYVRRFVICWAALCACLVEHMQRRIYKRQMDTQTRKIRFISSKFDEFYKYFN